MHKTGLVSRIASGKWKKTGVGFTITSPNALRVINNKLWLCHDEGINIYDIYDDDFRLERQIISISNEESYDDSDDSNDTDYEGEENEDEMNTREEVSEEEEVAGGANEDQNGDSDDISLALGNIYDVANNRQQTVLASENGLYVMSDGMCLLIGYLFTR